MNPDEPSCFRTAAGRIAFIPETRGDPLGAFPLAVREGRPYNLWLTERVLEPALEGWFGPGAARPPPAAADVERACEGARRAFRETLPRLVELGDAAVLAAMGVTANLLRTLALIGEALLEPAGPDAAPDAPPPWLLSRLWCGLLEYPAGAPYFPGRIQPPGPAARLDPRRRDPGHLTSALWCSASEVGSRCEAAIADLRDGVRRSGIFLPGDLRHLRGHPISGRSGPAAADRPRG